MGKQEENGIASVESHHVNEQSSLLPQTKGDNDGPTQTDVATLPAAATDEEVLAHARRLLYVSHLFAQFSEVAWQFCLILFLAAFCNYKSLILVSSYGLLSNGCVFSFGAKAGRFVDGSNRLFAAQRFILSENLCVLVASVFCYLLLGQAQQQPQSTGMAELNHRLGQRLDGVPSDVTSLILLIGIHILGAIAMVLDKGFLVAMERDWVVVMSQYAGTGASCKRWLSQTNVAMKQIDLSCKVAAPAVAGFLIAAFDKGSSSMDSRHGQDLRGAALMVGAINGAALVVEYICTARIYHMLPALAIKKQIFTTAASPPEDPESQQREADQQVTGSPPQKPSRWSIVPHSLQVYLDQSTSMAGISLSLLYLNVLSFGGIMTAYLVWRGMGLDTVGLWRGVSSAIGLLGTFAYHISSKKTSLMNTGMWSITYQFCFLSLCYMSLFMQNYTLSLSLLILGVCASRIGLWVFDISVTQLMQEYVDEAVRGIVGGVQQSLNSFFFLLSFGLGIVFPDPKDFHILVGAGYVSVGLALILYAFKIYGHRGSFLSAIA